PMWLLLYYFPVRTYVRTPRQLLLLLSLLLLSGVFIALAILERYRSGVAVAEYAYQLRGGYARSQSEHFFAFAIVSCVVGAAFVRGLKWRLFLLSCAIVMGAAVLVTFSRTAWMSVLIGLGVAWVLLTWRQRLQTALVGGVLLAVALGSLAMAFPQISSVLIRLVGQRFTSIGQGQQDLALRGRFYQLERALQEVTHYPLGGQGLGKEFPYYEAGARRHIHYGYIHNSYLATAYRYGIPMALLLVAALVAHFRHVLRQVRRAPPTSLWRMAAVTGVAGMVGVMLSLMMTENPLDMRITTMVLTWVLVLANVRYPSNADGS
ncbi:MAG: O-antigen ligase family protein, partial [Candidatus Kapabacteria bacterium]|nr:O-antigen ligase family protein [Candidatus Kapabacteria bacterium]